MILTGLLEGLRALRGSPLRSALAGAGVLLGVFVVVAVDGVGNGMQQGVDALLAPLDPRTFVALADPAHSRSAAPAISADALRRVRALPHVRVAAPAEPAARIVELGARRTPLAISAEGAEPFAGAPVVRGRTLDTRDIATSARTIVLTASGADKLHATPDAVGRDLRIGRETFRVVGILGRTHAAIVADPFVADAQVPFTTFDARFAPLRPSAALRVLVDSASRRSAVELEVTSLLRAVSGGADAYRTIDASETAALAGRIVRAVVFANVAIGSVAALVSGIGILNMMLVAVMERRREIGLRRAAGARRRDILLQFLLEAFVLAAVGSAAGALLGALAAEAGCLALARLAAVPIAVAPLRPAAIAVLYAIAIALAFGTAPALRAAALDPIDALRAQ